MLRREPQSMYSHSYIQRDYFLAACRYKDIETIIVRGDGRTLEDGATGGILGRKV
jgi:hypothetical protein